MCGKKMVKNIAWILAIASSQLIAFSASAEGNYQRYVDVKRCDDLTITAVSYCENDKSGSITHGLRSMRCREQTISVDGRILVHKSQKKDINLKAVGFTCFKTKDNKPILSINLTNGASCDSCEKEILFSANGKMISDEEAKNMIANPNEEITLFYWGGK